MSEAPPTSSSRQGIALTLWRRLGPLALWAALATFDTLGQVGFKLGSASLSDQESPIDWLRAVIVSPPIWGGLACYLGSFWVWMQILRRSDLSHAFPISSIVYVAVLGSAWVMGEQMTLPTLAGVALVVLGVGLIGSDEDAQGCEGPTNGA